MPPRAGIIPHKSNSTSTLVDSACRAALVNVVSRESGEYRFWVCDHADKRTCQEIIDEKIPAGSTILYTDEWQSYDGCHCDHAAVCHSAHEWARDDQYLKDNEWP